MKAFRRFCAASVLTLMLALSVFACQIETGIASPPPPPPTQATTQGQIETTSAGQIETTILAALNVLQGVLWPI